ncbi:dynein regulatory complex protein 9-like [Malaya genurostris]|uniref:dynein regulatory complex protein 9-like n=1 Tax=Malaya genurostris TaxID=325434 RepID=UPI0026F3C5E9|nr:dynein regulatory complex protein 9-like [Malaya genurostris]
MEHLNQLLISKLIRDAWVKMQILAINSSTNDKTFDEKGNVSIRQLLDVKIKYLEMLGRCMLGYSDGSMLSSSEQLERSGSESSSAVFDTRRHTFYAIERRILSRQLENLKRLLDLTHHDYIEERTFEISKNVFVKKWELSRMEQLSLVLSNRYEDLRKAYGETDSKNRNNIQACKLIDVFYTRQLDKISDDIEEWMKRFDLEKDDLDGRLQRARVLKRHWEELLAKFEWQREEIIRLENLERQHQERITCKEAATRIQVWWRAVMARLGIQPKRKRRSRKKPKRKGKKATLSQR